MTNFGSNLWAGQAYIPRVHAYQIKLRLRRQEISFSQVD
jgi:hypothetical protein